MNCRKILVVEDSELLHRMYDLVLARYRNRGAKIVHAMNGLEGLNLLPQHTDTDLVILDLNMPEMDGLEFLSRIKQRPTFSGIPVIIITTEGREEQTVSGLKAGAAGYLTKPFEPRELHGLIDKLFPQDAMAGEAGAGKRGLNK
jgi:two-component system, chemotaxis family, chemotaxis protein CheY